MKLHYVGGGNKRSSLSKILPPRVVKPSPEKIKILSPDEVRAVSKMYEDMIELSVIFNHDIVLLNNVLRWKPNMFIEWVGEYAPVYTPNDYDSESKGIPPYTGRMEKFRASFDLNNLHSDFRAGAFSVEEFMKYYMQIGYSLCGYSEVFGQCEASDWGLPDAKKHDVDDDFYAETPIDYMRRVHKGKILRL